MSMTLIGSVTVGSGGAASIDFTSIPSTYTDLLVVYSTRDDSAGDFNNLTLKLNNTTSGYSERLLYGTGSGSGASATNTALAAFFLNYSNGATSTSNTFSSGSIYIPNYAGSSNKSLSFDTVSENNATAAIQAMSAALWANTAAITRITLTTTATNLVQYSTATLYGVTKGSSGGVTVS